MIGFKQKFYNANVYFNVEESKIENRASTLTIDLSQNGLGLFFKDYQEIIMKNLWETDIGYSSRAAWMDVNKDMRRNKDIRDSISRASVINFLNMMVDEGLVDFSEVTGRGGHSRIYRTNKTEKDFWEYMTKLTNEKFSNVSWI